MSRYPLLNRSSKPPEVIDPRWLLKALGISFAVALVLALVTLGTYSWYRDRHPQPAPQQKLRRN